MKNKYVFTSLGIITSLLLSVTIAFAASSFESDLVKYKGDNKTVKEALDELYEKAEENVCSNNAINVTCSYGFISKGIGQVCQLDDSTINAFQYKTNVDNNWKTLEDDSSIEAPIEADLLIKVDDEEGKIYQASINTTISELTLPNKAYDGDQTTYVSMKARVDSHILSFSENSSNYRLSVSPSAWGKTFKITYGGNNTLSVQLNYYDKNNNHIKYDFLGDGGVNTTTVPENATTVIFSKYTTNADMWINEITIE